MKEREKEVPAADRSIFLTFSKGHPLSENEIRGYFFTRKFGDFIEAIHMQEVLPVLEQPLYARLVVRLAFFIAEDQRSLTARTKPISPSTESMCVHASMCVKTLGRHKK
ncbi:hypothetical protein I3843_01G269200 [Carya illinoinensis]|nr:hypothetical protein I3843_01G269200 [Carya illinoinensis]